VLSYKCQEIRSWTRQRARAKKTGAEKELEITRLEKPLFVGRQTEIKELEACLTSAIQRKGRTIFVAGEAGTGKTRLIEEFLKIANKKQIATMAGWCLSNAPVPYFPFMEAFKATGKNAKPSRPIEADQQLKSIDHVLAKALKRIKKYEKLSPNVFRDLTFSTAAEALKSISELKPTILFIDDLHWADSASLALLHYASRVLASERILIIGTFRSEELNANQEGQPHPLIETIRLMRREDLLKEITLSNLSQPDVVKVAEYMAGGNLEPHFAANLGTESQGNPLFVVESMRMLLRNRAIIPREGSLHLASAEITIPTKVKDIILHRLNPLRPDQRRTLDLASVIGEKFDPKLLAFATSANILDTLEQLTGISAATSLIFSDEPCFKFDHAKSREVLYGEIPLSLRREYHAKVAEAIEATMDPRNIPVNELAYHYARAENSEKALRFTISAGEDALAKYSNEEATNYFTFALQTVQDIPELINEKNKALEGLGDALQAKGLFENAGEIYERLANSGNSLNPAIRLRALRKGMAASQWRGDLNHALKLAAIAEEYSSADRLEYCRMLIWRGRVVGFSGDFESAVRDLEQALRISEEEYSPSDAAQALKESAFCYATKGKMKKALASTRRAITLFRDLEDVRGQMEARMFEAPAFFICGLYQETLNDYNKCIEIAEKLGILNQRTMAGLYNSLLLETTGDLEGALAMSLRTLQVSEKTDSPYLQFNNYQMLTREYAKLGDAAHAEEFHTKMMRFFSLIAKKGTRLAHASGVWGNAVFFASRRKWEKANSMFEQSLELLKTAVLSPLFEPMIKEDYAYYLDKQDRTVEANKLREDAQRIRNKNTLLIEPGEVQAFLMACREITVNEELEVRLDVVNISKNPAQLLRVESLLPSAFAVKFTHPQCAIRGDSVDLTGKNLPPFEVETLKFNLQPKRPGIFNLTPSIIFKQLAIQEKEEDVLTYAIDPVKIIVHPVPKLKESPQSTSPNQLLEFEFKTENAKKTFDFLVTAFVKDYMQSRLPLAWSGWRTMMEIVKHTSVSKHSIYGDGRSRGRAISELEKRGLIEARIFPKERGRGGNITKVRAFYDRDIVKRRIDQEVLAPKRKNAAPRLEIE
jgi:tetratricopeptide (TPR) repeat protein